jgi:hypothetical protein
MSSQKVSDRLAFLLIKKGSQYAGFAENAGIEVPLCEFAILINMLIYYPFRQRKAAR